MNPAPPPPEKKRTTIYYGWWVLAASFVMLFFNSAAQFSIGVMFKPIIGDFGWNRGTISMMVMINMAIFAFSMLIMGRLYDRWGPKWIILFSATLLGAGFIGLSRMSTIYEFAIYYGLLCGIGFSGCTVLVFSALVSKWFYKWRGLAISVALSGGCLGQFVLIPVYTDVMLLKGWQSAYLLIGIATLAINFLLTLLIVRGDPEKLGYEPLGKTIIEVNAESLPDQVVQGTTEGMGVKEASKTVSFWAFLGIMFICGSGDFLVSTHLVPYITDFGIPEETAANMLAWFGLMSLVGILAAGILADAVGNKFPIMLAFIMRVGLFILILTLQSKVSFALFSLGFGFTMLMTAVLTVTLVGNMFGFSHIGSITGLITTVHHLGGGIFAYLGGLVFDYTESYELIFIIYLCLSAAAFIACFLIKDKPHYQS